MANIIDYFVDPIGNISSLQGFEDFLAGRKPEKSTDILGLLSPEQEAELRRLLEQLGQGTTPVESYTGDMVAPQTGAELVSLAALEEAATGGPTKTAISGFEDILGRGPGAREEYLRSTVVDPAVTAFREEIMPELTRRFAGQAGFGSDRMEQERLAASGLERNIALGLGEAGARYDATRLAAAQGLVGAQQARIADLLGIQRGGIAAREQATLPLAARYAEFIRQQQTRREDEKTRLAALLSALGIGTKENIVTVTPGSSGAGGAVVGGVLGGLLGGGGGG